MQLSVVGVNIDFVEGNQMVQLTDRDEQMLGWLHAVRLADLEGIRHALTAFGDGGDTIILRRAQKWVKRMVDLGLVARAPSTAKDGSVVWATRRLAGWKEPNPFVQTARHEIAVASVSSRYLERGYEWRRDHQPGLSLAHQVDGIAVRGEQQILVEVELTQKQRARYVGILSHHATRLEREGVTEIAYFGTDAVMRAIAREADRHLLPNLRPLLTTRSVFDLRGRWTAAGSGEKMIGGRHVAAGRRTAPMRAIAHERREVLDGQH